MILPSWEVVVLSAGVLVGPAGYLLGRLHARFIQGERDRERAFSGLAGEPDWKRRVAEAEAAAVEHTKHGRWFEAKNAMDIALHIQQAHRGEDR